METKDAVKALSALAHEARLAAYRQLVQAGSAGLQAGQLADTLGMPPSSLSFHLKELINAGLLESKQEGRYVIYSVKFQAMSTLLDYLTENCCAGDRCVVTSPNPSFKPEN